MSDSLYHGDSLVSEFSMDRATAAASVKENKENQHHHHAAAPNVDFEKEELRERVEALEEKLADRDLDLAKCYKLIKGLQKLIPNPDAAGQPTSAVNETPSFIDDRLARERAKILVDLEKTPSSSIMITDGLANTTAAMDMIMNGTIAPEDLQTMKCEFVRFRDLCAKMFQQLQGTASFLEKLIRSLENSDDEAAKKLLEKIKGIHLDLNVSMNDASVMMESAQNAEMSLSTALERSIRVSMAPNSEVIALNEQIIQAETKYSELEKKYTKIVHNVTFLNKQNEKLQEQLDEAVAKSDDLQTVFAEKDTQLAALLEEKRLKEERNQNLVPEIIQEMTNIKSTLDYVAKGTKALPKQVRRR